MDKLTKIDHELLNAETWMKQLHNKAHRCQNNN